MSDARLRGWANAFYGVADYLILPIGMLLAAPYLLRHLGTAQYGVWVLAGAAVSSGGIVSGSFGDAVIKYVGDRRGRGDWPGVIRIVRNMLSINLLLSGILAIALWYLAPFVTRHTVKVDRELQTICLQSLRLGSGLLLMRSIESVFISTLRAFETYGPTVRISICSRIAILTSAIVLTRCGRNVVCIMVATLFISTSGALAQALVLRVKIGSFSPIPLWHQKTVSDIATFGTFSWVQAISSVAFSHADRLFVGFFMGAPAVAYYGLCVQAAQPIHGLISSGLQFLFPHLSARLPVASLSEIRRKVAVAFKVNIALVGALSFLRSTAASDVSDNCLQLCVAGNKCYCPLCSACRGTCEGRDISQSLGRDSHAACYDDSDSKPWLAGSSVGETRLRANYLSGIPAPIQKYLASAAANIATAVSNI